MADLIESFAQASDKLERRKRRGAGSGRIIAIIKKCKALFCITSLKEFSV